MIASRKGHKVRPESSSDPIRDVEEQLAVLFTNGRRFIRRIAHVVHPELQPSGLYLLRMLENHGPSRPSMIAEYLEMDRSAVSRLIHALAGLGLIERTPDPDDKRAHMLALTSEGEESLAQLTSRREGPVRVALRDWDDVDVATFAGLLARMNDELDV